MFASRLKALRVGKGLTQADFSRMFHVASGTIAMWETGKRTPDLDTLRKIAVFFGVSTDYLLDCHGEFAAYLRQYYDSDTANDFAQKCGIDVSLLNHLNSTQTDVTPRSPSHSQATFGTDDIKQIAKAIEVDYKYLACLYDGYDPCSVRDVTIPENDLMRTAPTTVGRSLLDVNLDIFDGGDEKTPLPFSRKRRWKSVRLTIVRLSRIETPFVQLWTINCEFVKRLQPWTASYLSSAVLTLKSLVTRQKFRDERLKLLVHHLLQKRHCIIPATM